MQSNPQQHRLWGKPKRLRRAFTTEQINFLETQFKRFPYIDRDERQKLATFLKIEERPIKIWFQNRRMKKKKENKEFDVETDNDPQELSKDQLNNVPAVPLTNEQRSYSLPLLTKITNATAKTNAYNMEINKDEYKITITNPENVKLNAAPEASHPSANYYKETGNRVYLSPYFHQQQTNSTTLPFTTHMKNTSGPSQEYKSNASAEFSINLCKKYKQKSAVTNSAANDDTINQEKNTNKTGPTQLPKEDTKHYKHPNDFSSRKQLKLTNPELPKPSKQVPLNNTTYYPFMPTIYAHPFMSPGGVLWNPVNLLPVMTTNAPPMTISNCKGTHEQSKNCNCNCHGSVQNIPFTVPPSLQNPYAQYLINLPYHHTSP